MASVKVFAQVLAAVTLFISSAAGQSKKELIHALTQKADSLQKTLLLKNESLHQLEIKLARYEGAQEAHDEVIKRLESKYETLRDSLSSRNALVTALEGEKALLQRNVDSLETQGKDLSSQKDSLFAELQSYKKPAAPASPVQPKVDKGLQPVRAGSSVPVNTNAKAATPVVKFAIEKQAATNEEKPTAVPDTE